MGEILPEKKKNADSWPDEINSFLCTNEECERGKNGVSY